LPEDYAVSLLSYVDHRTVAFRNGAQLLWGGDLEFLIKLERGWSFWIVGITLIRSKELSKSSGRASTVKVFIADGSQLSCQLIAAAVRRGRYRTRVIGYATDAVGIRKGLVENDADVAVIGARLENEDLAGF
jgi:hypothetical protein